MSNIYTHRSIVLTSFLGGPLAVSYMIYKNYRSFQNKKALQNAILFGLFQLLVALLIIFFISEASTKLPGLLIPIIQIIITHKFIQEFQSQKIKETLRNGAKKASIGNIILVILIASVCWIGVVFLPIFLLSYL